MWERQVPRTPSAETSHCTDSGPILRPRRTIMRICTSVRTADPVHRRRRAHLSTPRRLPDPRHSRSLRRHPRSADTISSDGRHPAVHPLRRTTAGPRSPYPTDHRRRCMRSGRRSRTATRCTSMPTAGPEHRPRSLTLTHRRRIRSRYRRSEERV